MKVKLLMLVTFIPLFSLGQLKNQYNKASEKTGVSITAGAEVMNFSNHTLFGSYVSPEFSFQLTPKFNLSAGFVIGDFFTDNAAYAEDNFLLPLITPQFSNAFFARGSYAVNSNLVISGSTYTSLPDKSLKMNPLADPLNYKDFRLGLNYKVTDGVQINAEFGYSNSPFRRYNSSPFMRYAH